MGLNMGYREFFAIVGGHAKAKDQKRRGGKWRGCLTQNDMSPGLNL